MQNSTVRQHTRGKSKGNNPLFPLLISVLAGEIITILFLMVVSVPTTFFDVPVVEMVLALISAVLGSGVAGLLTGMAYRKEKLFMGVVCGIVMSLILLVLNLLLFRDPLTVWSAVKYILIIFSAVGATFLVKTSRKKKIKH